MRLKSSIYPFSFVHRNTPDWNDIARDVNEVLWGEVFEADIVDLSM